VGFDVTEKLLMKFIAFIRYWEKMGVQQDGIALFRRLQETNDSVRREVLYNILNSVWGTHETSSAD
jgi:hypothetical protein